MIVVDFLGTPGKCPYYSGASGFGLEVFVFGFPCFCSQRVLLKNSRADIATLFFAFPCHRACTFNSRADLVFTDSALYSCSSALTSRPVFFVTFFIAPVGLIPALTSFSRAARFIRVLPR